MKLFYATIISAGLLGSAAGAGAQAIDNPGEYMSAINKARGDMDGKYMAYMSATAHTRKARKVEKLRQEVLDNITQSKYKTSDLPPFKGDNSLRKGSIDYIQMCYNVFNEDYKKIVNMEELAEQSVDEMQAYLLLQDKVDEKLKEASANLEKIEKDFAAKYNIQLTEEKSALGDKMEKAGQMNKYVNSLYIVFFKCNWEDSRLVQAMNDKKVNDVEQARSALESYANDGLKALDTTKPFDGDPALLNACKNVMKFYKNLATQDAPKLTEFYLKQEEFDKLKKAMDAKGSSRTKEDVDAYNKAVKDINASVNTYNQTNQKVNNGRTQVINDWNDTEKRFAADHMPRYK